MFGWISGKKSVMYFPEGSHCIMVLILINFHDCTALSNSHYGKICFFVGTHSFTCCYQKIAWGWHVVCSGQFFSLPKQTERPLSGNCAMNTACSHRKDGNCQLGIKGLSSQQDKDVQTQTDILGHTILRSFWRLVDSKQLWITPNLMKVNVYIYTVPLCICFYRVMIPGCDQTCCLWWKGGRGGGGGSNPELATLMPVSLS